MRICVLILLCFCLGCKQKSNNKSQLKTDSITVKNTKIAVTESPKDEYKLVEKKGVFLGKADGKIIKYDHSYTESSEGGLRREGYVSVYIKNRSKKIILLDYNFDGYEYGEVEFINLLNHPFIYISESARFGLYGRLYSLDLKKGKTNPVSYIDEKLRFIDVEKNSYKIKGLHSKNIHGIVVDSAKNITSEDYYTSDSDTTYTYNCKFKLIKIKHNTYTLKLVKAKMVPNL